ncbi:MAG: biotin/lipoyl-binding protein [Bacteroidetes bacterium]|nr:biotin/lipoyl-binding protein [Fibrella sp.]
MYQTTVNDTPTTHQVDFSAATIQLNGEPFDWDITRITERTFHIIRANQSFTAEVLDLNVAEKTVSLKINGHIHTVRLKDRFDLLLEKMGMSAAVSAKVNTIKAPMPGLIVSLNVRPGDVVQKGDSVLVLEAMKMENLIKAPGDATVKGIKVVPGDRVEKGQVLVEFV